MTDFEDFCMLVKNVRHAQKMYFSTRQHYWLIQSKELERRVDDALVQSGIILTSDEI